MYIIAVEGNIGTGKSTLGRLIQEQIKNMDGVEFIQEPVHKWVELKDDTGNILDKFYKDQDRWSYTFQHNAFITRAQDIMSHRDKKLIIIERSVLTDRNVFAKLLHENGKISDMEWQLYTQWYDWLNKEFSIRPDRFIYLKAEPDVSYDRMKKRLRDEEEGVPYEYIKHVHEKHEEWMNKLNGVDIIDVNDDFVDNVENQQSLINNVMDIINGYLKQIEAY
jgi:deoxyguanosine kinase